MKRITLLLIGLMFSLILTNAQNKPNNHSSSKKIISELNLPETDHSNFTDAFQFQLEAMLQTLPKAEQIQQMQILAERKASLKKTTLKKAAIGQKLLVDSVISYLWDTTKSDWLNQMDSKEYYLYDNNGNKKTYIFQYRDTINQLWVNNYREDFSFDINGNNTGHLYQHWDLNQNKWINDFNYVYTFDDKGNETSELNQNWNNVKNSWIDLSKTIFTYDDKGNKTSYSYQYWGTLQYIFHKDTYIYDSLGNMTKNIYQSWSDVKNDLVNAQKTTNNYNAEKKITDGLIFNWSENKNDWDTSSNFIYSYNADGKKILYLVKSWNINKRDWINWYKDTFIYDKNGLDAGHLYQVWDTTKNQWVIGFNFSVKYDDKGHGTNYSYQWWDNNRNDWGFQMFFLDTFDVNGNQIGSYGKYFNVVNDKILVLGDGNIFTYDDSNNITNRTSVIWDTTRNEWINNKKGIYYYPETLTNMKDKVHNDLKIFPNPATIKLYTHNINDDAIARIFGISGKMFISTPVINNQIDISNLKQGVYTIVITSKTGSFYGKFIKQ